MNVLKIGGLVLIAVAGAGLGLYAAAQLRQRVTLLDMTVQLIRYLQTQLRYTAAPADELLKAAAALPEFAKLGYLARFTAEETADFHIAWQHAVMEQRQHGELCDEDAALLCGFGEKLGTTDLEGQLANCNAYESMTGQLLEQARRQSAVKGRLYSTLGTVCGLTLALFFL